jgi:transcriptional antiterminator
MDTIAKRCYLVVNQIADADRYISSGEIAANLKVSAKTVRKDVETVAPEADQMGIHIQKKPGLGYYMDPVSANRWHDHGKELFQKRAYSVKEQRFHYILQRLLSTEAYIKSADLADELFVSQTVISAELRDIRRCLAEYELTIENIPSYGIRITGKEQYIRSYMLTEYCQEVSRKIEPCTYAPFQAMFTAPAQEKQGQIDRIVRDFLVFKKGKPYHVSESHMKTMVPAIRLAVNCRHRKNKIIFSPRETYETQLTRSYQAVLDISRHLEESCGICLSETDLLYLGNLLLGYRTFLRFDDVSVKENYYRTASNSSQVLMCLFTRYGVTEFAYNKNLRERLALYLLALEARLRTHMTPDNGELELDMNRYCVIAREFATYVGEYLESIYHCPLHQSEYERMAVMFLPDIPHIGKQKKAGCSVAVLSCKYPRDIALAVAQRQLSSCEGFAGSVIALESYQAGTVADGGYDLLLTDAPKELFKDFQGTILPYSFRLSAQDFTRVNGWYCGKCEKWQRLKRMFAAELFVPGCRASSKEEAAALVQKYLMETGYADEGICYDLLHATHPCITISTNGIGFLKTRYSYGEWSFCGVFQFAAPLPWQGTDLHTLMVFSAGTAEAGDFLLFNGWLEELLWEKKPPLLPSEARTHPVFLEKLHDYYINH